MINAVWASMNFFKYLILLLLPVPLVHSILKGKHYKKWVFPFLALIGIYVFIIIGSISVIYDKELFSYQYYFTILIIECLFYIYYYFIDVFSKNRDVGIHWGKLDCGEATVNYAIVCLLWLWNFAILYLYYQRHGLPILFEVDFSRFTDIYALRAEKLTNLPEGAHWYNLAFIGMPSFLVVFTYILKKTSGSIKYKVLFYINFSLALLFMSFNLTKTQYVYLLAYFFILKIFIEDKAINFKRIAFYASIVFICLTLIMRIYLMDRSFYKVVTLMPAFLFERIFVVYSKAHAYIMKIFPYRHDYFYGGTFSNPGGVLPYKPVNIAQFLGWWANRVEVQNYSVPSFSEGFANFGMIGFLMITMIMFLQTFVLQMVFIWCPKNPLFLSIFVIAAEKMLHYAIEPIQLIVPEELIFVFLVIIGIYYLKDFLFAMARNRGYRGNSI